jgi:AcrR family transcriptional regulator
LIVGQIISVDMMARPKQDPEIRRQQLMDAAEELFVEKGFEGTAVSDIVGELDVAQGTFYYYFDSKDDILCMVIRRLIDKSIELVRDIIEDGDMDPATKVLRFYEVGIRQRVEHPILDQLRLERNAKLYFRLLRDRFSRMVPLLQELVEQGVREGRFQTGDPFVTAAGLQQVITLVEMLDPTPETFGIHPDVIAPLQDQMERILGAEPGTLEGFEALWESLHEMQWD